MDIPSFILNRDLPGLLITLAGQSILISIIGFTVLKVLSKRSAPLRSLVCSATMIALGLTLMISIGFHIKGISWSQATLPFVMEKNKNTKNSILLPSDQNTIASSDIKALPLEARSQIPVEKNITTPAPDTSSHSAPFVLPVFLLINITGLIWLAGILFQMVRLGYGIIIVKKFLNSLQSCKNDNYDKILQTVAGRFGKKRLPKLYSSTLIKSPVTIGLFNPVVIIPQRLTSIITENEMKSILLHELAHIYHYDQIAGVVKRFVMAFHWWNPFVYQINRHHEQAREEVSDNYVLRELQPRVYSQCLMDLTKKVCLISSYPTAVGMAGRRFNLRKRIEQILSKERSIAMETKLYLKAVIFCLCLVLVFGVAGLHGKTKSDTSGDEVPNSSSSLENKVYLIGEFRFPGEYRLYEGDKISSVIERAGGLTKEAYPYGAVFTRESVKEIWEARKQEYISKLEQDILTTSTFSAETKSDAAKADTALQKLNAKKQMLERLKLAKPTGRMVINLSDAILLHSGKNNLELRPGDRLVVGRRPDSVHVTGEVFNPSEITLTSGSDIAYYLDNAGGMTGNAAERDIFIVRADGTVVSKGIESAIYGQHDSKHGWWGSFKSIELNPGDTIIVPQKIIPVSWLKDTTIGKCVMYEIAVSAGILN